MGCDKIHMNEQVGTESIKIQRLEELFELFGLVFGIVECSSNPDEVVQ